MVRKDYHRHGDYNVVGETNIKQSCSPLELIKRERILKILVQICFYYVGIENEIRYPSFPRISETQVTFHLELKSFSEGKISLENLGMRNPSFLNLISLVCSFKNIF